jgi:riboflavin transporter FmnP
MHINATGTYVIVAGNIYRHGKTKKGAVLALVCGTLAMAPSWFPQTLCHTLLHRWPRAAVAELLLPGIIPFNLVKAGINSVVTFFVYKRVSHLIHKFDQD